MRQRGAALNASSLRGVGWSKRDSTRQLAGGEGCQAGGRWSLVEFAHGKPPFVRLSISRRRHASDKRISGYTRAGIEAPRDANE
jgi:hypothetical protein